MPFVLGGYRLEDQHRSVAEAARHSRSVRQPESVALGSDQAARFLASLREPVTPVLRNLPRYFDTLYRLLRNRGILLNHGIASRSKPTRRRRRRITPEKRLLQKYIFPGSELTNIGHTLQAMEHAGFEVHDVEGLREHYARTARASIVCWDGSTWHGNYPRQLDGERVVLHITFSRLALRTLENYDHLDEEWLEGKPHELSVMLGREDFLGSTTIARGSADYTKIPQTFTWAKT